MRNTGSLVVLLFGWLVLNPAPTCAQSTLVICANRSNGNISLRQTCRRSETAIRNRSALMGPVGPQGQAGLQGSQGDSGPAGAQGDPGATGAQGDPGAAGPRGDPGAQGPQGPSGADGQDGQLRIYGDGSAGAVTIGVTSPLYFFYAADGNLQFTDLTVPAGVMLTVESGTVIRATGVVTVNGMISVSSSAKGGRAETYSRNLVGAMIPAYVPAHPGIAIQASAAGQLGADTGRVLGGYGGAALPMGQARALLWPGHIGGGGGGPGSPNAVGGAGGGSLVILAKTGIDIGVTGSIVANGNAATVAGGGSGPGGGGGGVVVLAAQGYITQSGDIFANGGNGGTYGPYSGSGGGGGGGIIHLMSPSVSPSDGGTLNVNGGVGGSSGSGINSANRMGGGGGGASGGAGGAGADVLTDDTCPAAGNGSTGQTFVTLVDPTALL